MNRQVEIKVVQIARMVVKGMKLTQIAIEMGMSYTGLVAITRRPEYLEIEEQVRTGVVSKMDMRLDKRAQMADEMEDIVPEAMRVLIDNVTKKRDLKAALEVLDRDPKKQFAKTSRVDNSQVNPATGLALDVLSTAVKDADITHTIMKNAQTQQQQTKQPIAVSAKAEA